jgi:uncharacterized membrane protein YhiD involved in acid resistance
MVLLICAVLGAFVGYRLGTSRQGFVTLALVSIGSAIVQIGHLFATSQRSSMTMLPLVVGTVLVASLLAGAVARRRFNPGHPV